MRTDDPWHEELIGGLLYLVVIGVEAVVRGVIHTGRTVRDRLRGSP